MIVGASMMAPIHISQSIVGLIGISIFLTALIVSDIIRVYKRKNSKKK